MTIKTDYVQTQNFHIIRFHNDVRYGDVVSLQQFIQSQAPLSKPYIIDLTNCSHLDSTALGTLALIAKQSREVELDKPIIFVTQGTLYETIMGVCFDLVFQLELVASSPLDQSFSALDESATESVEKLTEAVTMAHQLLAEISEENELQFKDVNRLLTGLAKS
ncbi:MAG: hypothetical protein HWE11_10540 [Gammaproteobacteria bacterium]|nr:hypothetical protein [Gammaproteobacteria bacterium]